MSNCYGENIKLTIFGQSHSNALGMTLEGIPAGSEIDLDELNAFLQRRAPGRNEYSTPRKEEDAPEFLCGLKQMPKEEVSSNQMLTCGTPITAIIRNKNTRSSDYSELIRVPRPGHADYTANVKYGGNQDYAGGGHFSGRLTAPLCIAGGIVKQLLANEGIEIISRVVAINGVYDNGELVSSTAHKEIPVVDDECGKKMAERILEAKAKGDSVGGIIECKICGLPVGLGNHMFGGMENKISQAIFGIPAVKGIEFGAGFEVAGMLGSENNDAFYIEDGRVMTRTNNSGGILGGLTNGMPLVFRAAFKPTPSIAVEQESVDLEKMENTKLVVKGRHDPCIVLRAVPCVEAAAAIAVYDAFLSV